MSEMKIKDVGLIQIEKWKLLFIFTHVKLFIDWFDSRRRRRKDSFLLANFDEDTEKKALKIYNGLFLL